MIEVGRDIWRLFGLLPPTQAGPATEDRMVWLEGTLKKYLVQAQYNSQR